MSTEERSALHPAEIAKRPATYAALILCATALLWLILKLHEQVVWRVDSLATDVRAIREGRTRDREELVTMRVQFTADLKAMRTEFGTETKALRVDLGNELKLVRQDVQAQSDLLRQLIEKKSR